jgi:hypothetical protein
LKQNTFDILVFIGRPAAGKSEVTDYLRVTPPAQRQARFHIGEFNVLDDFPMLWGWFEEDHILSNLGHPRLYTDEYYYFKWEYLWDLLTRRLCLEYAKLLRDDSRIPDSHTAIIEFSRGSQHGGYKRAFEHLSEEVIEKMAIVYVKVSWEESFRKNNARFNPKRPDSILEHGLPDKKIENLYKECDWEEISAEDPEFITIQGSKVPYAVFENEDDVITGMGEALGQRLEETLGRLWEINSNR